MKAIFISLLFLAIALMIAFSYARCHHRNGYGKQTRRRRTILTSENDLGVYGDVPHVTILTRYTRPRRDVEPMGL